MDNPRPQAELAMLKRYGPDVSDATLQKLVAAFGELRTMADQGTINYPYSTREVVNIVKHLQVRAKTFSPCFDPLLSSAVALRTLLFSPFTYITGIVGQFPTTQVYELAA